MKNLMSQERLEQENAAHAGTGGRSQDNAVCGFRPAFFDTATCTIYASRFADGRPAPFHLIDGLPDAAVAMRTPCGRVIAARASVISGFERNGYFYTRSAAARALHEWSGAAGFAKEA
jgi:hypothetical protein